MVLFHFTSWLKQRLQQEREPAQSLEDLTQTFILEPIYTPSGLVDAGEDDAIAITDSSFDEIDIPDVDESETDSYVMDDDPDESLGESDNSSGDETSDSDDSENPVDVDNEDIKDEDIGEEIPFSEEEGDDDLDEVDEEPSSQIDPSEEEEIADEPDSEDEIADELEDSEESDSEEDEITDELEDSEESDSEEEEITDELEDSDESDSEEDESEEEDEDDSDNPLAFEFPAFNSGIFRVGDSGEVGVDFLFDGGAYQGEVAFFSLAGFDELEFDSIEDFIAEAAQRAASGSEQGHIVIRVADEGARFTGSLFGEPDWNTGVYQGVKTFNMTPGDEFGVMLVPNGRVSEVLDNPSIGGAKRPLFSLATANPEDGFHLGQIADLTGDGNTFVFEDQRFERSDRDYDDVIFQIRGAVGDAVHVENVINPDLDWRQDDLGKALLAYAKPYITPREQLNLADLVAQGWDDLDLDYDFDPESLVSESPTPDLEEIEDGELTVDSQETEVEETEIKDDDGQDDSQESASESSSSNHESSGEWSPTSDVTTTADSTVTTPDTADPSADTTDTGTDGSEVMEDLSDDEITSEEDMGDELTEEFIGDPLPEEPVASDLPSELSEMEITIVPERFEFAQEAQPLVGIIDTGFAANNPDLNYENITLGYDWVDGDNNPLLAEGEGNEHGTHILGLIAAQQDNDIGIDGINPDAPIWLGRAVGSGQWANSLVEFVDAAVESGQPNAVVNLSMDLTQIDADGNVSTRYELTPQEWSAIEYARQNNVLLVVAAGNDAGWMSALGQASETFDNIVTVGAAEEFDPEASVWQGTERAEYSSYGQGLYILAYGGTEDNPKLSLTGDGVGMMAGTSVSAAKVTGAVSQVWAANPALSYRQVVDIIQMTATDLGTAGWNADTGAGLLNMTAAVHLAKATRPQVHETPPISIPDTWMGEGVLLPGERAVATQFQGQYYEWESYTIQSGDTLGAIAHRTMGNGSALYYNFIAQRNNIANPNLIYPGQRIQIPRRVSAPSNPPSNPGQPAPQAPSRPTQVSSQPGHVNGNVGNVNLNMRASASLGARVVRTLPRGQNLTILRSVNGATYRTPNGQTRSDWYEVQVGNQRGYVAGYYVSQGHTQVQSRPGHVNGNVGNVNLNMRASASLGARVVRTLPRGQNLTILRSVNGATYRTPNGQTRSDWYEVEVGGQRGYVAGYYVSQGQSSTGGGGSSTWQHPLPGYPVSSEYGPRGSGFHYGIDVAAPTGTPIRAAKPGRVVEVGYHPNGWGNFVRINHPDGFQTIYAHMSRVNVSVGQTVSGGSTIGQVGSTGWSTGPHLHFEVRVSPYRWQTDNRNPRNYIRF